MEEFLTKIFILYIIGNISRLGAIIGIAPLFFRRNEVLGRVPASSSRSRGRWRRRSIASRWSLHRWWWTPFLASRRSRRPTSITRSYLHRRWRVTFTARRCHRERRRTTTRCSFKWLRRPTSVTWPRWWVIDEVDNLDDRWAAGVLCLGSRLHGPENKI